MIFSLVPDTYLTAELAILPHDQLAKHRDLLRLQTLGQFNFVSVFLY